MQDKPSTQRMTTMDAILDAALQLLEQGGERSAGTNHIAAAAGISPGNLYYHFPNREAILRRLFERFADAMRTRDATIAIRTPLSALVEACGMRLGLMWRYRGLLRAMPMLIAHDELQRSTWQEWREQERRLDGNWLRAMQQERLLPDDTNVDALAVNLQQLRLAAILCEPDDSFAVARESVLAPLRALLPASARPTLALSGFPGVSSMGPLAP